MVLLFANGTWLSGQCGARRRADVTGLLVNMSLLGGFILALVSWWTPLELLTVTGMAENHSMRKYFGRMKFSLVCWQGSDMFSVTWSSSYCVAVFWRAALVKDTGQVEAASACSRAMKYCCIQD